MTAFDSFIRDCLRILHRRVGSIALRGLDGFDQDGVLKFSDGLNIVHALSGGGKSRLLRYIFNKHNKDMKENPIDVSALWDETLLIDKSIGQGIFAICMSVLQNSPDDACVLMDDCLDSLDPMQVEAFLKMAAGSPKQIILTVNSRAMGRVREILRGYPLAEVALRDVARG